MQVSTNQLAKTQSNGTTVIVSCTHQLVPIFLRRSKQMKNDGNGPLALRKRKQSIMAV